MSATATAVENKDETSRASGFELLDYPIVQKLINEGIIPSSQGQHLIDFLYNNSITLEHEKTQSRKEVKKCYGCGDFTSIFQLDSSLNQFVCKDCQILIQQGLFFA